ncbi:MAG: tetratricopeptide repeat protein [Thermodesulfobacteriota bacterium]
MSQDKPIFVGRTDELQAITDFIHSRDSGVVIIKGHTDMGKTALSEELARCLENENGAYCGHHCIEFSDEPARPLLLVLAALIGQMSRDEKHGGLKLAKEILTYDISWSQGKEVSKVLFKDIVGALRLKGTYEKVVDIAEEAVEDASVTATVSGLLAEQKESVRAAFIRLLKTIAEKNDRECRFVLIVDQVECGEDVLWDFLVDAARSLPRGFYLVLTVNHEKKKGEMFFDRYRGTLQNLEPLDMELGGLTRGDIESLIEIKQSVHKTPGEVEEVRRLTGGRPLLVLSWIDSEEFDRSVIDKRIVKYDSFFEEKLASLSNDAYSLAAILSILPMQLPGGLEDYAILMEMDMQECHGLVRELRKYGIFKRDQRECWFDHDLIKEYIVRVVDQPVHKVNAGKVLNFLSERYPDSLDITKNLSLYSFRASLITYGEEYKQCIDDNLSLGDNYYRTSSYVSALESYLKALAASRRGHDRKNEGTTLNNIGLVYRSWDRYDEAIKHYEESLAICRGVGDRAGEAITSCNIVGSVYFNSEDPINAEKRIEGAYKIAVEIGMAEAGQIKEWLDAVRGRQ